jgi:hypothetical protein
MGDWTHAKASAACLLALLMTAEFVHDTATLALGVDYAQGEEIGPAMPLAEALAAASSPLLTRN